MKNTTRFSTTHLWARQQDNTATTTLGLTDFGQGILGDITLVNLPAADTILSAGDPMLTLEGIDGPTTFPAPLSGTVLAINDELNNNPELINEDPLRDGWLIQLQLDDTSELDDLMDSSAYEDLLSNHFL